MTTAVLTPDVVVAQPRQRRRLVPGFSLTLGFTITYLSLIVLFPLVMVFVKTSGLGWEGFVKAISSPRVIAACKLTFGASALAAAVNASLWICPRVGLVRYPFSGPQVLDAAVDLPFRDANLRWRV
jgi:sulfate transport system permease protein